jgi:hypothetical protein
MRLLSMAIASLAIPLTFLAARIVMSDPRALLSAALLAAAPGFAIDASRVANDSLAIALVALLCCLMMRRSHWILAGAVLGAGMLTKAYCLGLLVGLFVLSAGRAALPAALAGGWWYGRNALLGLSAIGWLDTPPLSRTAQAIFQVNWLNAARVTSKTFLWYGAWSFLSLKSWIYTVLQGAGLLGTIQAFRRNRRDLIVPLVFIACFVAEVVYGTLNYQAIHNIGSLNGWYLWPVGGAMAIVMSAGLGRETWLLTLANAAIDVYGATLMARHYHANLAWLILMPLGAAILYVAFPYRASGALAEALPSRNLSNQ